MSRDGRDASVAASLLYLSSSETGTPGDGVVTQE